MDDIEMLREKAKQAIFGLTDQQIDELIRRLENAAQ